MKKQLLLFFSILFFFVTSCNKDGTEPIKAPNLPVTGGVHGTGNLTVEEARALYEGSIGQAIQNVQAGNGFGIIEEASTTALEPIWFLARQVNVGAENSVVVAPIKMAPSMTDGSVEVGMQLVFYESGTCELPVELIVYEKGDPSSTNICSYSGQMIVLNFCDCQAFRHEVEDGVINYSESISTEALSQADGLVEQRGWPWNRVRCPDFGRGFWEKFKSWIQGLSSGGGGGGNNGGGNNGGVGNGGSAYGYFPYYYGNAPSGGGGGGGINPVVLASIFDGEFFNGEGQEVINRLETIIGNNNLFVCLDDLHNSLFNCLEEELTGPSNPNCPNGGGGGTHGHGGDVNSPNHLTVVEYIQKLATLQISSPSCLAYIIQKYQSNVNTVNGDGALICLIEANDFGNIPDDVVYNLVSTNGCYADGFLDPECVDEVLVDYVITQFLDNENFSPEAQLTANTLQEIKLNSNGELTLSELIDVLNAFELYFDDPLGNGDELINAMFENGVNPLAINAQDDAIIEESAPPAPPAPPGTPMTPDVFWQKAGSIKQALLDKYPGKSSTINNFFPCRVLGPAMEEAVLNSLGIPKNTSTANSSIPDGWISFPVYDDLLPPSGGLASNLIEVKGRFGSSFDYSNQMTQLQNYLNYLQTNTFMANSTIAHGLYMILPDGVSLSSNVISLATSQNVPILLSGVELGSNNVNNFRVQDLEFINVSSLNRSRHLFSWLPDLAWEYAIKQRMRQKLSYQNTLIDFQKHANAFETSYLANNNTPDCPND
jgi:hypothetical protein